MITELHPPHRLCSCRSGHAWIRGGARSEVWRREMQAGLAYSKAWAAHRAIGLLLIICPYRSKEGAADRSKFLATSGAGKPEVMAPMAQAVRIRRLASHRLKLSQHDAHTTAPPVVEHPVFFAFTFRSILGKDQPQSIRSSFFIASIRWPYA